MNNEIISAEEILALSVSQWASTKDIMKIDNVGRTKAYTIRDIIAMEYYKDNKIRNKGLIPMSEVIKYFDINLNYLKEVTSYEKKSV